MPAATAYRPGRLTVRKEHRIEFTVENIYTLHTRKRRNRHGKRETKNTHRGQTAASDTALKKKTIAKKKKEKKKKRDKQQPHHPRQKSFSVSDTFKNKNAASQVCRQCAVVYLGTGQRLCMMICASACGASSSCRKAACSSWSWYLCRRTKHETEPADGRSCGGGFLGTRVRPARRKHDTHDVEQKV